MSYVTNLINTSKVKIIDALLLNNIYKMPDGRQFYEATEQELESVLNTHNQDH
ncbi:Fur-regulated basic protein FbpA [Metabacillus litoralis]|uniref:Fur-regulated basic protein FbpA n=1 Tax=Metabacillus litoralis TaxID=152268 RepID=UPI001CFD8B34|nr:Fur-regulated basic protein FbpA [Metabacillus litoralis]